VIIFVVICVRCIYICVVIIYCARRNIFLMKILLCSPPLFNVLVVDVAVFIFDDNTVVLVDVTESSNVGVVFICYTANKGILLVYKLYN
jgi:hypothetical protein